MLELCFDSLGRLRLTQAVTPILKERWWALDPESSKVLTKFVNLPKDSRMAISKPRNIIGQWKHLNCIYEAIQARSPIKVFNKSNKKEYTIMPYMFFSGNTTFIPQYRHRVIRTKEQYRAIKNMTKPFGQYPYIYIQKTGIWLVNDDYHAFAYRKFKITSDGVVLPC